MNINVAKKDILELVLKRKRWAEQGSYVVDPKQMFRTILKWANELVPSESGSILLDDPILKHKRQKRGRLHFIACYGKGSRALKLKGLITCSMGVSSLKTTPSSKRTLKHTAETLIKRADIAMYMSKHAGRDRGTLATSKSISLRPFPCNPLFLLYFYPPEKRVTT